MTNVHQANGMNMMKGNETHDHAVYEKIKVLYYFRFAAEGLIFLIISISHIRQAMSQFGINVIHVINFSNVQNVLRISVIYVMNRVRIFVQEGWALETILPRVLNGLLSGPAKHALQAILYEAHCKSRVSLQLFSFSLAAPLLP